MPIKETGEVHLVKTDKATGATLAGAEFSLYDKSGAELQNGLTTDENGELTIHNLDLGSYYLKETKAPEGYKLSEKTWEFSVESGQVDAIEIQAENEKDLGEAVLTKVDSETNAKLSGAKFNLLNDSGEVIQTNLVSDENGEIRVQNLEPGDYAFQETEAPTNYDLATNTWPFTIVAGQTSATMVTAENNKTGKPDVDTGEVILVKQDSATGETLEGAVFDLMTADGAIVASNLTTDANGEITVTNLAPGKYSFKETKAPEGYDLASDVWEFTIAPNQPEK